MPNANVTVTVDASQVTALITNLQRVVQLEEQASRTINININTGQIDAATRSFERMNSAAQNIATIMRGLGSASNAFGSFASGIGNSFSSMSSLFGNRNVSTALTRFITYNALRGLTGNMSNIISRYDIMSTFLPYMAIAGVGRDQATASLNRINESILGLPIGLDEAAQRLRRYQMFMGDIEGATNLTIGVQNAILAGGASSQMQNMAYMQIDRLLSAGKLNQSRQWLSLIQGLGVSMRFISEQMGTTGMNARQLAAGLTSGKISTEEFLDALKELGKGESEASQGLEATLQIYKGTIEAWVNNINFAFARGGENMMRALNETLVGVSGQGITGYMKDYRDFLNEAFLGASDWIRDNPQALQTVLGEASNLLQTVQRFSAGQFASETATNIGRLFSMISTGLATIPEGRLESFASFATTIAGPLGQIMGMSSGLGQLIGVFERFERFDFDMLIGDMSNQIGNMANVVQNLLGVLDDEAMSKLLSIGLVWGQPVGAALSAGAGAITTASMIRMAYGGLGGLFGAMAPSFLAASGIGIGVAGGAGLAYLLNNADQRERNEYFAQHGLLDIMGDDRYAYTQAALSAARQNYNTAIAGGVTTTAQATVAQATLRSNIASLNTEYALQAQYLTTLTNEREVMTKQYDELKEKALAGIDLTAEESQQYHDYLVSIDAVNEKIADTQNYMAQLNNEMVKQGTTVGDLVLKYGDLAPEIEDIENAVRELPEELSEAQQALNTIYEGLQDTVDKTYQKTFGGLKAAEYDQSKSGSYVTDYINILTGNTGKATTLNESIVSIADYINSHHGEEGADTIGGMIRGLLGKDDLEAVAPIINEVASLLESGNIEKVQELLGAYTENLYAAGAGQQEAVAMLQEAESGLIEYTEGLGSIDFAVFDPSEGGRSLEGLFNITSTLAQRAEETVSEKAISIAEHFGLLSSSTQETSEGISSAMQGIVDGATAGFEEMVGAVESGGEEVVSAVGEIPPEIEAKSGDFQAATASLGPPMEAGFNEAVNNVNAGAANVLAAIESAKAQIQAAAGAISINIPVNITTSTTTSGAYSSDGSMSIEVAEALGWATGGSIFSPIGSDIVPAMLTPGEYIIRKGAVDFFGKGLMDRINSLDIGGAFDRLMLSPPMMSRFGGNVYNRDSHNNVTQNVYTNNPNFANKRAWRFAL